MAGDVRALADLSRAALINEIQSPDIHYSALMAGESFFQDPRTTMSGLGVTPGAVPWMQAIDEATDIRLAVAQAKGTWATGIKIYANLSGTLVQRIIREGRRQGMPVWTHAKVYPANPFDSVGAHAVSHACMIARHVLENGRQFDAAAGDTLDYGAFSVDAPEFVRYAEALASSGTNFDATMLVYREQTLPDCGLDAVVAPIVAALHHSGVNIVAGTDADTPPEDPFPAIIEEMELLSKVEGMTNADVINWIVAGVTVVILWVTSKLDRE